MTEQGMLLAEAVRLIDNHTLQSTYTQHFGTINTQNLKHAHALL